MAKRTSWYGPALPDHYLLNWKCAVYLIFLESHIKAKRWAIQPDAVVSENLFYFFIWPYEHIILPNSIHKEHI